MRRLRLYSSAFYEATLRNTMKEIVAQTSTIASRIGLFVSIAFNGK